MARDIRVGPLFATPLVTTTLDNVDPRKIATVVCALRDAGFMYSGPMVAGLQTQGNFLLIDHPEVRKLRDAFVDVIAAVTNAQDHVLSTRGWANILRKGDASADTPHNHLPNHWSAVYYPQVPALTGHEGHLLVIDPREVFAPGQPVAVPPQTGMFVMFPSWLRHSVVPMRQADGERISVSLNAIIGPRPDAPAACYPPHRLKKRAPGQSPDQEFDPASPASFPYPA
ncbi:MAG: putative 2OG-Fe(II) oxygenase [Isosphaeraceae bacterium]|nr:putative 2OG-Fe(II) oxygenase [Isosphaeraceae bacterium]